MSPGLNFLIHSIMMTTSKVQPLTGSNQVIIAHSFPAQGVGFGKLRDMEQYCTPLVDVGWDLRLGSATNIIRVGE
ncbi:hypothetical protein KHA80_22370 [Anaerobacillus sp. HL2]|nr:hypothetical protein KHA80_22370 [Anaerobacillus sp. HL2]